jgi:hypothetical protein
MLDSFSVPLYCGRFSESDSIYVFFILFSLLCCELHQQVYNHLVAYVIYDSASFMCVPLTFEQIGGNSFLRKYHNSFIKH